MPDRKRKINSKGFYVFFSFLCFGRRESDFVFHTFQKYILFDLLFDSLVCLSPSSFILSPLTARSRFSSHFSRSFVYFQFNINIHLCISRVVIVGILSLVLLAAKQGWDGKWRMFLKKCQWIEKENILSVLLCCYVDRFGLVGSLSFHSFRSHLFSI